MLTGFDLCRAAMSVDGISAPEKSVLLVLAIMADNSDATCFPPVTGPSGLTAKTCLSERSVQRAIQALKDAGHISRRQLRHGCVYTIHPLTPATVAPDCVTGDTATPVTLTPVTQSLTPATVAPKLPVTTTSSKTSSSPKKRASKSPAFIPPSDIPEAEWDAFEEMRKRVGKPMTGKARDLAVSRLRRLAEDGYPPGDVLNHSTLNNYQGLFPPKDERNAAVQRNGASPARPASGFTAALQRAAGHRPPDIASGM